MGGLRCPKCGRHVVRRTHRSGVFERLLSRGSVYPFRCPLCGRRGRAPRARLALAPRRAPLGRLLVRRGRPHLHRGLARHPLPRGEVLSPREAVLTRGIMTPTLAPRRPPMSRRLPMLLAVVLLAGACSQAPPPPRAEGPG